MTASINLIKVRPVDRNSRFLGVVAPNPSSPAWADAWRWRWECEQCGKVGRVAYAEWEYIARLGLTHVARSHPTLDRLLRAAAETEPCPECGQDGPVGQHFDGRDFGCVRP